MIAAAVRLAAAVVALLALVATLLVLGAAQAQAPTVYVAFGDSITEGVGDEEGGGYPPRLEALLLARGRRADVRNLGLAGEATAEGLTRIETVLEQVGGDVLLLMEGTNDVPKNISIETTVFNLGEIARKAEQAGMEVVVASVIPRSPFASVDRNNVVTQELNETIRDLAGTSDRELADPFEVFITTPDFFDQLYDKDPQDPVGHPNARGADRLARVFLDVLLGVDSVPPVTGFTRPQVGRTGVRPNVRVRMDVWDFGTGMELSATEMLINGAVVDTSRQGNSRRLRFEYSPAQPFTGLVEIGLRSRDRASPPNTVDRVVSSFRVAGQDLPGDIDRSGRVDGFDLILLARAFGATAAESRYLPEADFNRDDVIDGEDLAVLAMHFGESDT
ncbi:MAG TPA: GDSL-type esterase/lipase family protein [Thermoanaerobaculia bacterium]|nr:GDSL-type esterase/lipase family protein [Thermoanaerobaculia bacterium]